MERTQIFDLMGEVPLYGLKAAFDDIMATAVKRQHEPQRVVGDLLTAEPQALRCQPTDGSRKCLSECGGRIIGFLLDSRSRGRRKQTKWFGFRPGIYRRMLVLCRCLHRGRGS